MAMESRIPANGIPQSRDIWAPLRWYSAASRGRGKRVRDERRMRKRIMMVFGLSF